MRITIISALVAASAVLVAAQNTDSCPEDTYQSIIRCTDQVYADEGKAPCSSSDWECICEIQQGLLSCYDPCPDAQDADAIRFNNENCAGQHGVTNKAAGGTLVYTISPITTTAPAGSGSGGSSGTTPTTSNSTPTGTTSATDGSSSASTTPTSDVSSPSTSTQPNGALSVSPYSFSYILSVIFFGGALLG